MDGYINCNSNVFEIEMDKMTDKVRGALPTNKLEVISVRALSEVKTFDMKKIDNKNVILRKAEIEGVKWTQ